MGDQQGCVTTKHFDKWHLALLVSGNTSLLGKSTTHKTPQSADLFALCLMFVKGVFSSGTWPRYQSEWMLFASISGDFCGFLLQYTSRTHAMRNEMRRAEKTACRAI